MLIEVDPGRAAGSHDRKLDILVSGEEFLQALEYFGSFLHYRQVGGEISVENVVEAEFPESCCELAGHKGAGCHSEFFAEGGPDRRGRLGDHDLVGIAEVVHQLVGVVVLSQCSGRADRYALSAIGAVGILDHLVECGGDGGVEAAADSAEGSYRLDIVAYAFAAAAVYALVHVPHYRRGQLFLPLGHLSARERHLGDGQPGDESRTWDR